MKRGKTDISRPDPILHLFKKDLMGWVFFIWVIWCFIWQVLLYKLTNLNFPDVGTSDYGPSPPPGRFLD
jgi:hypothetical protein